MSEGNWRGGYGTQGRSGLEIHLGIHQCLNTEIKIFFFLMATPAAYGNS